MAEIKPYNEIESKSKQVSEMFDSIAPAYDFMNTAMTGGLHRRWRNRALKMALNQFSINAGGFPAASVSDVLDIACGTGDVTFRLHEMLPDADVTGLDLSAGMLEIAKQKLSAMDESAKSHIAFTEGDSLALPYEDDSFDLVTVAYGVRNFERLQDGYAEMHRVLRPRGVLCVVELSEPSNRQIKSIYRLYAHKIIPFVGKIISKDPHAYTYLPESIAACPQRGDMTRLMRAAGFKNTEYCPLTLGVVTIYLASK